MTPLFVQCRDSSLETIVSVFSCHQDEVEYPNQIETDTSDSRWHEFFASLPKEVQMFLPQPT